METKGGNVPFRSKHLIITSNRDPLKEWFPGDKVARRTLGRRILVLKENRRDVEDENYVKSVTKVYNPKNEGKLIKETEGYYLNQAYMNFLKEESKGVDPSLGVWKDSEGRILSGRWQNNQGRFVELEKINGRGELIGEGGKVIGEGLAVWASEAEEAREGGSRVVDISISRLLNGKTSSMASSMASSINSISSSPEKGWGGFSAGANLVNLNVNLGEWNMGDNSREFVKEIAKCKDCKLCYNHRKRLAS